MNRSVWKSLNRIRSRTETIGFCINFISDFFKFDWVKYLIFPCVSFAEFRFATFCVRRHLGVTWAWPVWSLLLCSSTSAKSKKKYGINCNNHNLPPSGCIIYLGIFSQIVLTDSWIHIEQAFWNFWTYLSSNGNFDVTAIQRIIFLTKAHARANTCEVALRLGLLGQGQP